MIAASNCLEVPDPFESASSVGGSPAIPFIPVFWVNAIWVWGDGRVVQIAFVPGTNRWSAKLGRSEPVDLDVLQRDLAQRLKRWDAAPKESETVDRPGPDLSSNQPARLGVYLAEPRARRESMDRYAPADFADFYESLLGGGGARFIGPYVPSRAKVVVFAEGPVVAGEPFSEAPEIDSSLLELVHTKVREVEGEVLRTLWSTVLENIDSNYRSPPLTAHVRQNGILYELTLVVPELEAAACKEDE